MTDTLALQPHFSVTRAMRALRCFVIGAMVLAGGVVYMEPSPHEYVGVVAVIVCFGTGLRLNPRLWPLVILIAIYVAFGIPSMLQSRPMGDGILWMSVSAFLAATAVLYASFVAERPARHFALIGWLSVGAAVVPVTTAFLGYFGIAGQELFTLWGRARGTFQDPNVLGPFLVLPFLFLAEGALRGSLAGLFVRGAMALPIALAVFLTFSRGAWGHLALSCALLALFTFALSRSIFARMRVLIVVAVGLTVLAAGLMAALSVPKVQNLFTERAQLTQQYDTGHEGRFGRWKSGFKLAMEEPLGIGPKEFAKIFPEDPHNVYLNAFVTFGWGGGLAYVVLVLLTIALGFRAMLVPTPWQRQTIVVYSTFLPLAMLGAIIDTDHWRHFFLVLGCLWGLIAATEQAKASAAAHQAA